MKRGIRAKLIATFLLVNVVLLTGSIGLVLVNNYSIKQYSQVLNTVSVGYQLSQSVAELIDTYNQLVLSNSDTVAASNSKITNLSTRINDDLRVLDTVVVDEASRTSFGGLRNSIDQVTNEVSLGLRDVAQDKPTAFTHYQTAHHYYEFVQANSTTFTYAQLGYINSIKDKLHAQYLRLEIICGSVVLVAAAGGALYSFRVARKIVMPLSKLDAIATAVASGNMNVKFDKDLLGRVDEIGSLSHSFNTMFERLKIKIGELEVEKATSEAERAKDEAILASIGDGMVVTDSNGNVLLINSIAAELLDVQDKNIIGRSAFEAYILRDDGDKPLAREHRPLHIALKEGIKNVQSLRCIKRDGTKISLGITASPVMQQGAIIGGIQIIRNITKEKEIDRMKTEFISLASHQLRTPLSAIKWFSEMLLNGDAGTLNSEQADFAKNVSDSTERMIQLVNALLNISRIESGRIIVDPKPTDLSELVNGVVNDLKAKTAEKQQTLVVSVHKDLPKVNLDPHLIGQVYMNFLTNAIKYTPKGGEIAVFVSRKGEELVSQITDNGYGIPVSQQGRLFQKFFRAENITKRETDGTGLGLYLVKAIIESSGGKVWFESAEGKGTTFWFTLPMSGMVAKEGEVQLEQ